MNLKEPRFVILSEPRTGSNNVAYVLDAHPLLSVGNELLHPKNGVQPHNFPDLDIQLESQMNGFHWLASTCPELRDQVLTRLFSAHNGFKIHTSHMPTELVGGIVEKFGCTVILTLRQKLFEQAISNFIATHNGRWHSDEKGGKVQAAEPIRIEPLALFNWIGHVLEHRRELWTRLHATSCPVVMFEYEEIYSGGLEQRLPKFLKLLDILGVPRFGQLDKKEHRNIFTKVNHFLHPQKQKMTDADVAATIISNYDELKLCYEMWTMDQFHKTVVI